METKKWWQSKTVWSDILTIAMAAAPLVDKNAGTHIVGSAAYIAILASLGSFGIYGRTSATTTIQ